MSLPMTSVGRVCLCEWSGPVTVTMVVALLSQVMHAQKREQDSLLLILSLSESAARSIVHRSNPFLSALPALWSYCQRIAVACRAERGLLHQLRQGLCGPAATPLALVSTPLHFFEQLDDALRHAQSVFPHDVLELQRQRLKSGRWPLRDTVIGRVGERQ